MDRFARIVLGYHGNSHFRVDAILDGTMRLSEWPASKNAYDWLGRGIYFWEHAPERALRWATEAIRTRPERYPPGSKPAVVGAVIQLSPCLDLTEVSNTALLGDAFQALQTMYATESEPMPQNRGGTDRRLRHLDCLVINHLLDLADPDDYKTVRGAFEEGAEAFPGAALKMESHIQVAVRDASCILGVFRPNLER